MNSYLIGAFGWGGYDPLSFLRISTGTQLLETLKYGAMIGAAEFIVLGILFRFGVLKLLLGVETALSDQARHILYLVSVVPVREEVIFRFAGISALYALSGSLAIAVALSSVAFGLGHIYQGIWNAIVHVIGGLILAFAFLTGGLIAAIAAHATYNFIVASLMI